MCIRNRSCSSQQDCHNMRGRPASPRANDFTCRTAHHRMLLPAPCKHSHKDNQTSDHRQNTQSDHYADERVVWTRFTGPRSQVAEPQNVLRCANSGLELLALPPQLPPLNQCSRNTPSTACSSAGLMSFECATVTAKSGPSSDFSQNARKSFNAGKFGNIS
jgi:hypothetical protein